MASPTYALHRIRRNVRRSGTPPPDPPTQAFDERREELRAILEEMHVLGGDLGLDELIDWVVAQTKERKRLPDIDDIRAQALAICRDRDVALPAETPLKD